MPTGDLRERYSRQTLLPGVGLEGQEKWASATLLLAGEGVAFEAAKTALVSAGAPGIKTYNSSLPETATSADLWIVLSENVLLRRQLSRLSRVQNQPVLFGWSSGSGLALFFFNPFVGKCPCFECFEVMNPKAFNAGTSSVQRILGAMAASEALQWLLKKESPLTGQVWVHSLDAGVSFHHEVRFTPKCPARLLEEGAKATP